MRVVGEQNVNGIRHHQRFELLQSPVVITSVVYPDQIKRFATQPDGCALLSQHMDTLSGEQASDGLFNRTFRLMVSQASENAVRRPQARQHTNHVALGFPVPTDVVPGQGDQVSFQAVGNGDAVANVVRSCERTDMNVGKLGDAKTLEGFGQARQPYALTNDFYVLPLVQKPYRQRRREWRSPAPPSALEGDGGLATAGRFRYPQ